jgi:hypothetical protein
MPDSPFDKRFTTSCENIPPLPHMSIVLFSFPYCQNDIAKRGKRCKEKKKKSEEISI